MDVLAVSGIKLSPVKGFEQLAELRAQNHEHLRGRNNVTSCRSPTREINTKLIKDELKKKRHQEFLKRRSVSPEPCRPSHSPETSSAKLCSPTGRRHPVMIVQQSSTTDGSNNHRQGRQVGQEKGQTSIFTSTSHPPPVVSAQKTVIGWSVQSERSENRRSRRMLRDTAVQTDSGLANVKESDIQLLAEYLQEALWREEAVKKKLAALQESTLNLVNSSNFIWTSRCSEDLLKNKIRALEEQLQVCLQKFPKDGVKKLVFQMEKQKVLYEEKALVALQKAMQDKTEAVSKAATLQEALITANAETVRWQKVYEELKRSFEQLRENQRLSNQQLQQLQEHMEISRSRAAELGEEVALLEQEKQELQYNISLLEVDNHTLRDEIQRLRGDSESQDFIILRLPAAEETEPEEPERRDSLLEEQLRHIQEKLCIKESECEELQAELHTMEQECKSTQARLSQCRDELRQLSHRRRSPKLLGSRCVAWIFSLLLLTVVQAAMLWLWYPPFRQQIEDLYTDIGKRVENYLMEVVSSKPCFKPI
eukprot:XP_011620261.1 PREDICTED: TRAF3-interacting JNK-activating modulator [Takifugu rubripes]